MSVLGLIPAYLVVYDALHIHGFILDAFNAGYVVIIIPIWIVDGVRGLVDVAFTGSYKRAAEDISKVTVVIACKDGEDVIGETLADLLTKFSSPQIIVISNGSTDRTVDIIRDAHVRYADIKAPIGKVRAINAAIPHVKTPYVLLLDDDTLLRGASIPTGLLDQGYAGVAFRVHARNVPGWVTRIQAHEYRKGSDISKRRQNRQATVQNISGAVGLFTQKELMRQIHLHTGEFSGEDLQRTLLLHLADDNRGVVLSDSIVETLVPATLRELFNQRVFGWFPGQYTNAGNYFRLLFSRHASLGIRDDALYNIFFVMLLDIIRVLALPIMIFYPWYALVTYISYVLLESTAYLRNGRREPFWVILAYPLYGLFGLVTRVGAFATFLYRRTVAALCRLRWRDDYRRAPFSVKAASSVLAMSIIAGVLTLNVLYDYSHILTNIDLGAPIRSLWQR